MKDPAVLIYFDKWIASTNGMRGVFRAWYMDLLMYQYDNPEGIPNDLDFIAGICRILPSEYNLLEKMVKQVLEKKFKLCNGKWKNDFAEEIISKRQNFKEKRSKSGNIGVVIKLAKTIKGFNEKHLTRLKKDLYEMNDENVEQAKNKQVLEQMLKLYINEDEDIIKDEDIIEKEIIDFFHEKCSRLPKVQIINQQRKKSIKARINDFGFEKVKKIIEIAGKSNFLSGENKSSWTADFDWIMKSDNFIKILEGSYNNKEQNNGQLNRNTQSTSASFSNQRSVSGSKISGQQVIAKRISEHFTRNTESGNNTIDVETVIKR